MKSVTDSAPFKTSAGVGPNEPRVHSLTIEKSAKFNEDRFKEDKSYRQDKLEFERQGSEPGLVIIFNQEMFKHDRLPKRVRTLHDVKTIITCFSRLGFNIEERFLFSDRTRQQILDDVDKILAEDLSQVNSIIVFVLTHGGELNNLEAYDQCYKADELWKKFAACKMITRIPKMFVFQACKGTSKLRENNDRTASLVPGTTFSKQNIYPNMLWVYSTLEGKVSFRNEIDGGWFIQELCKNFSTYGRRDHVLELLLRTSKCICKNYYDEMEGTDSSVKQYAKQMPIFVSTLKKKFYLNRNKERNFMLKLQEQQRQLLDLVKELRSNVDIISPPKLQQ